jgi:hypothetical protein
MGAISQRDDATGGLCRDPSDVCHDLDATISSIFASADIKSVTATQFRAMKSGLALSWI